MLLPWLRKAEKRSRKKVRRRPAPLVLRAEVLEDRAVPSATLVRDINTHTGPSLSFAWDDSSHSVELNGHLFFFADDGVHGRELWTTDGTDAGTQLVKDINPGPLPSNSGASGQEIALVGDHFVFAADDGVHGSELWISDGTADGTLMLKDIAPATADASAMPDSPGSSPMMFHEVGGKVFFLASDATAGQELWVTDGTSDGTHLVADINPGAQSSNPSNLTTFGDKLYFTADDGIHGNEVWVTDGTAAGTHMLADIGQAHSAGDAGEIGSNPGSLTVAGGKLFFSADDNLHGDELWVSDGTEAGTHMVADLNTTPNVEPFHGVEKTFGSNPFQITPVGDRVFFVATGNDSKMSLYSTDGTEAGTGQVTPALDLGSPYLLKADGSTLYFASGNSHDGVYDTELWKTDGTADGTVRLLRADEPPAGDVPYQGINDIFAHDGSVYFTAGNALNKVLDDGTGTGVVHTFGGPAWENPQPFGTIGDKLFLAADDGEHGIELWALDGGDVAMVKDINTTTLSSGPRQLLTIGDVTYFVADDGEHGQALWKTDGTADGTVMVKSFFKAPDWPIGIMAPASIRWMPGPWVNNLTEFNGTLFFTANDGIHGEQLWKSDGTEAGTVMLTGNDAKPGDGGGATSSDFAPWSWGGMANLTVSGGQLYFTSSTNWNDTQLWKTDGTVEGTVMVREFQSANTIPPPMPAADGAQPAMVPYWASLVTDLTDVNGTLFFSADDGTAGAELWRTDGTAAGTVMVKDINPNTQPPQTSPGDPAPPADSGTPLGSSPSNLTVLDGKLYFFADDGSHGRELWVSDGTADGTQMVVDLLPGSAGAMDLRYSDGSAAPDMIAANGKLYFNATDATHGQELWISDGTAAGTKMVSNIHPDDGAPLLDGGPVVTGSMIQSLTAVGNLVYFSADDGVHGQELWKTDGTAAGTSMVRDIYTGDAPPYTGAPKAPNGSFPTLLTNVNGVLYFVATDAEHGPELWMSDGTEAGTVVAAEPTPGPIGSMSVYGTTGSVGALLGGKLLFAASAPGIGEELFSTDAGVVQPLGQPPVSAGGPYHVVEGGTLELHGAVSNRPDANRLTYTWDLDGDGQFNDAKGQNPTMVGAQLRRLGLFGGPAAHVVHMQVNDAAGNEVGTATADLWIDDAPLTATGVSLDVTEGQKFNRNVASFKDPGGFEDLSHYAATIDWGDGTTAAGTILRDGSNLRVAGAHTYAHHGNFNVEVSISDDGGPAATATSTVLVHDAAIYVGRSFVRGTAGRTLNDVVATIHDMNAGGDVADFSAAIDWGDGTTSAGTIAAGPGGFQVMGSHVYSAAGDYAVKVTVHSTGGSTAMAQSSARIDVATIVPRGLTANTTMDSDAPLVLAAFRDTDRAATADLFSATIDWADGSTSDGTIATDGSGGFRVGGSHHYARTGLFSVRVTVQDAAGTSASTVGTVRVVS
jgi:ELWxxDGT repeat protein